MVTMPLHIPPSQMLLCFTLVLSLSVTASPFGVRISNVHSPRRIQRSWTRADGDGGSWSQLRAGGGGGGASNNDEDNDDNDDNNDRARLVVDYLGDSDQLPPQRALIVMDAFCPYHGMYLAGRVLESYSNVAIVYVLSDYVRTYLLEKEPLQSEQWNASKIPGTPEEVQEWIHQLNGGSGTGSGDHSVERVAVYCESDSGLADAELLRQRLNVTCQDDPVVLPHRRNKYLMNECIRNRTQLAVVQQHLCDSLEQALEFANQLWSSSSSSSSTKKNAEFVIVKPVRGVATESVFLCSGDEEVTKAWETIIHSKVFGSPPNDDENQPQHHTHVLVQEFLQGTEYAVDVVARAGEYKVAAVWRYDKRPANGGSFCYFKTELVDLVSDSRVVAVTEYVVTTLKALGIQWGVSHNEVIVTEDKGPVLVEVNCRQHNMDFLPLTMACIGYNALDMAVEAFLDTEKEWNMYPNVPSLRAGGCMVHLVNYNKGALVATHFLDDMKELPSVLAFEVYPEFLQPGSMIEPTVDIRSDAGWVQLVNDDYGQLERDYRKIVEWMPGMFETRSEDGY